MLDHYLEKRIKAFHDDKEEGVVSLVFDDGVVTFRGKTYTNFTKPKFTWLEEDLLKSWSFYDIKNTDGSSETFLQLNSAIYRWDHPENSEVGVYELTF